MLLTSLQLPRSSFLADLKLGSEIWQEAPLIVLTSQRGELSGFAVTLAGSLSTPGSMRFGSVNLWVQSA